MRDQPPDPAGGLRILVVDDNPEVRQQLERSLRRFGHEVVVAADGGDALKLLVEQPFEVMLTDITMPGIDGHTLLRHLASLHLDTAVIVISGGGTMADVVDALRTGAVDYLNKPWKAAELVSALGRAEEVYNQRRTARRARPHLVSVSPSATAGGAPPAESAPPQFASLLEQVRRGEITLPPVHAVVRQLRELVAKPNATAESIAALIERDPALAARLLRLSNTTAYARLGHNDSVGAAIGRIGLRQVQSLVETIAARQYFDLRVVGLRPLQARIAASSLAKAISFRALAELLGTGRRIDPELSYMTGLLADAGASFLLWAVGENNVGSNVVPTAGACLELVQNFHEELGGRVLQRWGMDPTVIMIAQTHHAGSPPAPPSEYWNLAVVGMDLAERVAPGDDPTRPAKRRRTELVERCAANLFITRSVISKLEGKLRDEFQSLSEAL
jgi:HD-like signal output (HDOD) protein/ActR/RegA family two-component response regulator